MNFICTSRTDWFYSIFLSIGYYYFFSCGPDFRLWVTSEGDYLWLVSFNVQSVGTGFVYLEGHVCHFLYEFE